MKGVEMIPITNVAVAGTNILTIDGSIEENISMD